MGMKTGALLAKLFHTITISRLNERHYAHIARRSLDSADFVADSPVVHHQQHVYTGQVLQMGGVSIVWPETMLSPWKRRGGRGRLARLGRVQVLIRVWMDVWKVFASDQHVTMVDVKMAALSPRAAQSTAAIPQTCVRSSPVRDVIPYTCANQAQQVLS